MALQEKPLRRGKDMSCRGHLGRLLLWLLLAKVLGAWGGLTCKDGFVSFELLPSDVEAAVCEAWTLPQVPQVIRQLTFWYLQHVHVGLSWNVNRILDDAYLCMGNVTVRTAENVSLVLTLLFLKCIFKTEEPTLGGKYTTTWKQKLISFAEST